MQRGMEAPTDPGIRELSRYWVRILMNTDEMAPGRTSNEACPMTDWSDVRVATTISVPDGTLIAPASPKLSVSVARGSGSPPLK